MKTTSKAQIALYLGVHVLWDHLIKKRKLQEDHDLYLDPNERLELFPGNLIGTVAGCHNFSEMVQIQCIGSVMVECTNNLGRRRLVPLP